MARQIGHRITSGSHVGQLPVHRKGESTPIQRPVYTARRLLMRELKRLDSSR